MALTREQMEEMAARVAGCDAPARPDQVERARERGSVMTPGEIAAMRGATTREVAVVRYALVEGGRVPPPISLTVRCDPGRLDGVMRSVSRLLESRGWQAEVTVRTVEEAA